MANYTSEYSGAQIDAILALFHNKGLGNVTGIVKRNADGTFEAGSAGSGTVTSVGVQNDTDGGLTVTGSPVTSSGTIKIKHTNVLSAAQTTAKLFPIKYDKNGHITGVGSEVTSLPASDVSSWAKAASKPTYTYDEVGAASSGHTHDISLATDTGTSTVTLASAGKYKLTAGGKSVIFTMPTIPTVSYPVTSVAGKTGAVTLSASDVGLGNVGNFKAVSTVASQGLTTTEQSNARANIGAGTSSLTIGTTSTTAAAGDHTHSGYASSTHTHGNIQNGGTLQTTDVTIASGDKLVVTDSSDSNKVARTSISFDGSTATKALTQKGTWETFGTSNLAIGTTATTAAAGNHTHDYSSVYAAKSHEHDLSIATDTGTSSITLASDGKYKLTAGGKTFVFTMPTIPTVSYPVTSVAGKTGAVTLTKSDITDFPTSMTPSSHTHGNITNGGDITATAPTIASGDCLVINDDSASKITNGPAFDGSTTTQALTKAGTWATFGTSNLTIGTSASTAAAGNHDHTLTIAADTGTSALDMAADTKYKLTAGGKTFIFKTPAGGSGGSTITSWNAGSLPGLTVTSTTVLNSASVSGTTLTLGTTSVGSASGWSTGSLPSLQYS